MDQSLYENYAMQIEKESSITKAAKALGISQPALSMALTQLEKKIGFAIFNRKSVPLTTTEAGERYLGYLKKKQVLEKEYRREINDILKDASDRVSIGAANVYIQSVLIDAVTKLHQDQPDYQICIESGSVPELMELVKDASLDCLISTSKAPKEEFISIAIRRESTFLCIPAGSPLEKKLPTDPKNLDLHLLDGERMIYLKSNQPMQISADKLFAEQNITPIHSFTVDQISTALALVEKGIGCCFATSESLRSFGEHPEIVTYAFPLIPDRYIYAVYPKDRYIAKACMELINLITNQGGKKL